MTSSSAETEWDFDATALQQRYREERDRRIRVDGDSQYVDMAGRFAHFRDDPYVAAGFSRAPVEENVEILIVGAGLTGLTMAARLREVGISDVKLIDKAGDFGGTWYWNRYPGVACDVESYIYLPLLEETGYTPQERYAKGDEILAHCQAIGRQFNLYPRTYFQTVVTSIRWQEEVGRWIVKTNHGDIFRTRHICLSAGPQSRAKLPGIPGIERFQGHSFHTSRWDYGYTGGDSRGHLTQLSDKRVAIIGTGATAIQCIPHLAAAAKQLYVVQRTPASVDVRANRATNEQWSAGLTTGWQALRRANFERIMAGMPYDKDLVNDSWTSIAKCLNSLPSQSGTHAIDPASHRQLADYKRMESVRNRVDSQIKDRQVAESLKPFYNQFCKRPCFHDEYLQSFNRLNVTLIDTKGLGLERITEAGFVGAGKFVEVDCLIYSTGFDVAAPVFKAGGYELIGRNDISLADKWQTGIKSLHGLYTHGFPNMFILGGIHHAAATINFVYMVDEQAKHVAQVIKTCLDDKVKAMDVRPEAEAGWALTIRSKSTFQEDFFRDCTPGYLNKEGEIRDSLYSNIYGGGPFEYFSLLQDWRTSGFAKDLNLVYDRP